jgi:hypothetical protein
VGSCISRAVRAALLATTLLVLGGSSAAAAIPPGFDPTLPNVSDGPGGGSGQPPSSPLHHGPSEGHLPPTQQELELVSRLEPTGAFGDVEPGQLADVAVHKGYAYLNSWDDPECQRGGTYVIDIRNPGAPREAGFIPAQFPYYHGEGAHVVSINTPAFQGDVLAVNNETYGDNVGLSADCTLPAPLANGGFGGFDLYDVTNPERPVPLVLVAGDSEDDDPMTPPPGAPNAYHSVFVWQDGPRAFLVASDNIEETDVDIFDITNPRAPIQVGDFDLDVRFPQILNGENANGDTVLHHDVVVKHIDGRPVMKADYWDAGYVQLDVSDPSNPTLITDTTFAGQDPFIPDFNPEGNAHQGEFSFDNQFLLAADEDFGPYRLVSEIGGEPVSFGFGVPVGTDGNPIPELLIQPGDPIEGDTRFIGEACTLASIPAPQAGETIAVAERGTCDFDLKAANASDAGYEAILIFNNVLGAAPRCEGLLNMTWDDPNADIQALFVPRSIGFRVIDAFDPATYRCVQNDPTSTPTPAPNRAGLPITLSLAFDGWGYAHLYDAKTSAHLDAFAVPEGVDERYAEDFGVLSIHEFATDPTENLAYSAYYSAGMRVLQFDRANGLRQVGAYIAPEGNDFWGVEQFTTPQGQRLIAGSDRDFGLYLFRYTGPGAAQPPACSDLTVMVAYRESANVPLNCSDPNGNPLRQSRLSSPSGGTVTDRPPASGWTYQHAGSTLGPAGSFTFRANDGAADSNVATANLVAVAKRGRCVNPFVGTNRRDTIIGSRFGDRIRGRRAGDSLRGRAGRDCVLGNAGRDRISGHGHADRLLGNGGRDRVAGNAGRDRLFGNQGNDRLLGGGGRDRLRGGSGRNRYSAGAGAERVFARNNKRDRIRCGKGRDRVVADQNDRVAGDCERVRRG